MKLQILLDKRAVLTKQIATLKHQQSHDQRKADTLTKIHLGEQVLEFLKTNQSATSKAYFIRGALSKAKNPLSKSQLESLLKIYTASTPQPY